MNMDYATWHVNTERARPLQPRQTEHAFVCVRARACKLDATHCVAELAGLAHCAGPERRRCRHHRRRL